MHVLVAGGSGFLGRALSAALTSAGHRVTVLSRHARQSGSTDELLRTAAWTPDGTCGAWARPLTGIDIVVNLAGESIGTGRWNETRKTELLTSRIFATRSLAAYIRQTSPPPALLLNASAIGYYGNAGDTPLDERAPSGPDFLARLARDWEQEACHAEGTDTRVALVRTGIVLDPRGGALARMLLPFRLGAGGRLGTGRQYMSWIHRDDWVAMMLWLTGAPGASGAYNATAPNPVRNADFTRTLGRVLRRPAVLPAPAFALRLALGEMAEPLLLFSQRVVPARATAGGFTFRYPELEAALRNLL